MEVTYDVEIVQWGGLPELMGSFDKFEEAILHVGDISADIFHMNVCVGKMDDVAAINRLATVELEVIIKNRETQNILYRGIFGGGI